MNKAAVAAAALVGALAIGALLWWRQAAVEMPPAEPARAPDAPAPQPAPASAPAEPTIAHPIEAAASQPDTSPPTVESALVELFGRKAVLSMFQLDGFARRLAATVDNLGRSQAPAQLWPVNPTAGRFSVTASPQGESVISADNGLRYTPFVLLVETVDMQRVVAAYVALYPQFQRAYQDLGFPKAYFNDRLVAVIDELLATPDVEGPLAVVLPQINGPLQPERPWVLYEFADPELQALTAGQKLLLRMGPVNQRRMKTKLAELRRLVTAAPAVR